MHTKTYEFKPLPLLISWVIACVLVLTPSVARAEEEGLPADAQPNQELVEQAEQPSITANTRAAYIDKHGNVTIDATCASLEAAFAFGDVVTVSFLDTSIDVPFCSSYSDVDSGMTAVFARPNHDYCELAINMGDFASTYGIAVKQVAEGGAVTWVAPEGVEEPIEVVITLKEAGGYYAEWVMRHLSYTNERSDYPQLSDDEFANFREVTTSGMGAGVLYRSASPVNNKFNRSTYADAAIQRVGVMVIVDLSDTEDTLIALDGYDQTYFSTVQHLALGMSIDAVSEDTRVKLAEGLRYMAQNPGIYLVHCLEGKDRSGFVVALLECLMGASQDEVIADYMVTFYNYYGVTPDDSRYDAIAEGNIIKTLQRVFGVESLEGVDLAAATEAYLQEIGLSQQEIAQLKENLASYTPPVTTVTLTFEMGGLGQAPEDQAVVQGECAVRPSDPVAPGFRFAGWYADEARTQEFDFATPLEQDTTVYAKWAEAAAPRPVVVYPAPVWPRVLPWYGGVAWGRPVVNPWYRAWNPFTPVPRTTVLSPWRWQCRL